MNYRKAYTSKVKPQIYLRAHERETEWLFFVEDNSIGIDAENAEKIFDIFTRLHSQQNYEGAGMGLAICKKIVERNGGRIWVEPAATAGSKFYFTILKRTR